LQTRITMRNKMNKIQTIKGSSAIAFLCLLMTVSLCACGSDDDLKGEAADSQNVEQARSFLDGNNVIYTVVTINGVNKTLLDGGCPAIYNFKWNNSDRNTCTVELLKMNVGEMPITINFRINVKAVQLNSWEKDEYKGNGWIKLAGDNGTLWFGDGDGSDASVTENSSLKGYYNVNTHEINFIIDYNSMNVKSECPLQTIDKSNVSKFDSLKAQYEKDLAEYKKQHGLS
jgi:hypothetical protein